MKLKGSITEKSFADDLIQSHKSLFCDNFYKKLRETLQMNFHDVKTAYFIDYIPEQGEDLYTMLVNHNIIAKIEMSRDDREEKPIVEIIDIDNYKKGLSRIEQIKLAVAIDLAKKDMALDTF